MSEDTILAGDFRVLKFDGMFHVVFRPELDQEWFRIIASFYTYERAYSYCDIERAMFYDGESETADEEREALRAPPKFEPPAHQAAPDGVAEIVRNIYEGGEHVEALPYEPPHDQPEDQEEPKDYHARLHAETVSAIGAAADDLICSTCGKPRSPGSAAQCRACYSVRDLAKIAAPELGPVSGEPLTDQQSAVLDVLSRAANPAGLVSLSLQKIASTANVPHGSITFLLDSLEKKRLMAVVERGKAGQTTIYRVERAAA